MQQSSERPDLAEIEAFVAVAEAGGFAAAAKRIGRDASIMSRRVGQLEALLGVRLFVRTTRRVALTEVGEAYLKRVQIVLEELSAADLEASERAVAPRGLVRITAPISFGRLWLAPLVAGFLAQHDNIRVDLRLSDSVVDLVAEGFDVAVRVGVLASSSLQARKLANHKMRLVAAPRYFKARGCPATPEDVAQHDCVGFTGNSFWPDWPLHEGSRRKLVKPAYKFITDNSEAAVQGLVDGIGLGLAPDWMVGPAIHTGVLKEVLESWTVKGDGGVYAVMPPGKLIPGKTRAFVEYLAAQLKAAGDWQHPPGPTPTRKLRR